jgi:hypothetical protein
MAQPRIFISHAPSDATFAYHLAEDLRNLGANVRLNSSLGFSAFVLRLDQVQSHDVLLLILTPTAIVSPWVQQEMNMAIFRANQGKMRSPIVVIGQSMAVEDIPPLWSGYTQYDAVQDSSGALAKLAKDLHLPRVSLYRPVTISLPPKSIAFKMGRIIMLPFLVTSSISALECIPFFKSPTFADLSIPIDPQVLPFPVWYEIVYGFTASVIALLICAILQQWKWFAGLFTSTLLFFFVIEIVLGKALSFSLHLLPWIFPELFAFTIFILPLIGLWVFVFQGPTPMRTAAGMKGHT